MTKHAPSHITIGCSHTNGTYLPPSDHWIDMIFKRTGIKFFRSSKNAAGLSFLVLFTKQYIKRGIIVPENVKYVIIQKPKAYRHPFWGKDKSGYRYVDDINNKLSVQYGMHTAIKKWERLSKKARRKTSKIIFKEQLNLLVELKNMFPNAQFAYYHYWVDYIAELLHRPLLAEVNVQLGIEAENIGMDNWGTIIDPKTIKGVYDKEGDIVMLQKELFSGGWICSRFDMHPIKRYHEVVTNKVEQWLES